VTWSRDYTNQTDHALVYGPSAITNVMCNVVLAFYPLIDLNNAVMNCFQ
jgi:hypothetical protein